MDSAFDNDLASRYAGQLTPPGDRSYTWQQREQDLNRDIAAAPTETAASFVWNFNDQYTRHISSLVASGDFAGAKSYYDQVRESIDRNRDSLLSIAQVQNAGQLSDELAKRANGILMGEFNQRPVQMSDGSTVTLGQVLADNSPYLADKSEELKRLNFGDAAIELYLSGDRNIRTVMDPFLRQARGQGGPDAIPNRIQMQEIAELYASNADRMNNLFGDGTARFMDYVREGHKTSGNGAATMRGLMDFAEVYSNTTGVSGAQLASDVVNGYNSCLSAVTKGDDRRDQNGVKYQTPITDEDRSEFDAMLLPALRETIARTGKGFSFNDPRLKQSLREMKDILSYTKAMGADLFADARKVGNDINGAFGAYAAEAMTGMPHHVNNFVSAVRDLRGQLGQRLVGGRDFAEVASSLSGQMSDYLSNIEKTNGHRSTCEAADVLAFDAHTFLANELIPHLASGKLSGDALMELMQNDGGRLVDGLAAKIAKSFHGAGRDEIAAAVAQATLDGFASGGRVCMEDLIGELAFGASSQALSDAAKKTAQLWYSGNVAKALQFSDQRTALREQYLADGRTDAQARRAVAAATEAAYRAAANGSDPNIVFDSAINTGRMLMPVPETRPVIKDGKVVGRELVKDTRGNQVYRIQQTVANRGKAFFDYGDIHVKPDDFVNDRPAWDAVQQLLAEQQKRDIAAEEFRRRKEIAAETSGNM